MTSFLRICSSLRRLNIAGFHLCDRKILQRHAFIGDGVIFRSFVSQNLTADNTTMKPLPSSGQNLDSLEDDFLLTCSNQYSTNSVENILSSVEKVFTPLDVVYALKSLKIQVFMKKTSIIQIQDDSRFFTLCKAFEDTCHSLHPSILISGLRSLLQLGIPPSDILIENLGLIIVSKIHDFLLIDLIGCLHLLNKYPHNNWMQRVVAVLIKGIERELPKLCSHAEVLMLIQIMHLFSEESAKKLHAKVVEVLPQMETKELVKMICVLAKNNKRNVPLLKAIGFYLREKKEKPNLKDTVDVLYSLNTLNYLNPNLLFYLTEGRQKEISHVNSAQQSVISGLLSACGQLKWKHSGLLDACGSWILQHIEFCTSRELVSYVLTIAALNYVPKDSSSIAAVMDRLQFKDASEDVWLDVIWSLAVLDHLDKKLLIHALSPDFYKTLLENSNSQSVSNQLKLLNLKCILKLKYPEFFFSCDLFLDTPKIAISAEAKINKKTLLSTLENFIPSKKYMCTEQIADTGIFIDAEFIMDKDGKPLLLSEYGLMSNPTTRTKNLPADAKRIALMILLYKDFTLNERSLTGINALAVRLLSSLGYVVVQVPFDNFVKNSTKVKKVMYLSQTIKNAITRNSPNIDNSAINKEIA